MIILHPLMRTAHKNELETGAQVKYASCNKDGSQNELEIAFRL